MQAKKSHAILFLRVLLLSIITTVFLQSSYAQNYTQMSLPEGAIARLGKGKIKDFLYSPDGNVLAVVSTIGIWLYDTETYNEIKLLPIPLYNSYYALGRELKNVRFSTDGQTIMGESKSSITDLILVWNVNTGECKELNVKYDVTYSPDRQKLTIKKENKTIELWQDPDDNANQPLKDDDDEKEKVKIAFNPNGKTYATTNDENGFSIHDTQTEKQIKRINDFLQLDYSSELLLSPNGKLIIMLQNKLPIHVWDTNTGKLKYKLIGHLMTTLPNQEHRHYDQPFVFEGVAFSPDGKTLACGSMDGTIRLWDLNNGKLKTKLNGHIGFVNSIVFSSDGKHLATGSDDGSILLWNTESWKHETFHDERMSSISCLSFNQDGSLLAVGSKNGNIYLIDVEIGIPIRIFKGHKKSVSRIMFSPDGQQLASTDWDRSARLWDIETEELLKTLSAPMERTSPEKDDYWKELLFTQDGNLLAINSETRVIHFWNVNTGQFYHFLIGHAYFLRCFSLSTDMQTLASYSADDTILLWNMSKITNVTNE